jgi:hypothetical protein
MGDVMLTTEYTHSTVGSSVEGKSKPESEDWAETLNVTEKRR